MSNYVVVDIECIPNQKQPDWAIQFINEKVERKRGENNKNPETYASLNPEFGQIICIGLYISRTDEYKILSSVTPESERETIQSFYKIIQNTPRFVTFNGHNFDFPYILKRTCILGGINPHCVHLKSNRYDHLKHFDILQILSNYGMSDMYSLSTYCKIFGIPINDESTGSDVYKFYKEGKPEEIYKHCLSDIHATNELYLKIKDYV